MLRSSFRLPKNQAISSTFSYISTRLPGIQASWVGAGKTQPVSARPITSMTHKHDMYNNKVFVSKSNSGSGEVDSQTRFYYRQDKDLVWAEYSGGSIVKGFLIATVKDDNSLDMRYQHVNSAGQLMTGRCSSVPQTLDDGRLRMLEKWTWTSGDCSSGESVIEEVREGS